MEQPDRCPCCHAPLANCFPPASEHHIVKRSRRRCDEPWNLIRLCGICHLAAHNERPVPADSDTAAPELTMANVLWFVMDYCDDWDDTLVKLSVLYGGLLPSPEHPPQWFIDRRKKHGTARVAAGAVCVADCRCLHGSRGGDMRAGVCGGWALGVCMCRVGMGVVRVVHDMVRAVRQGADGR